MSAPSIRRLAHTTFKWGLLLAPLLYLWFRVINNLRVEWETNPQYSYGYIVPFLCLGLVLHRWQAQGKAESGKQKVETTVEKADMLKAESLKAKGGRGIGETEAGKAEIEKAENRDEVPPANSSFQLSAFQLWFSRFCFLLFVSLAFLYLPTRLIELATPEWRLIQWAMGVIATGLTLAGIYLGWGWKWLRTLAFPIGFFLVAIPWPTFIEGPIIQSLTRINAAMVIEVMGAMGIPALQHGNVIEVGTGVVGIDEACSGIRSFQSSIMISLFLGALYNLTPLRRIIFVPIGFVLAMIFNLGRTSFLTYVAAKEGVEAIEKYHDPAGLWILIGCTVGLWLVGMLLKSKGHKAESKKQKAETGEQNSVVSGQKSVVGEQGSQGKGAISVFSMSAFQRLSVALLVWLLFVEVGTQAWYRSREARLPASQNWTVAFPQDNPTFRELPMAPATFDLLRFDDGKQGAWSEPDGTAWQAFYFNWLPGRVAGYLAKRHTPEICMPATGREMLAGPELMVVNIHGIELPVRRYRFGPDGNSWHVYHCRWESGALSSSFVEQESARYNLIRGIWAGRGNQGQKIIQVLISGTEDPEAAKALLVRRLEEMIKVEGSQALSNAETLKR